MKTICFIILLVFGFLSARAQNTRKADAIKTLLPVKIDGYIREEAWKNATYLDSFVQQRPVFGKKETPFTRTEAWLLYDDNAVYVSGICHERKRDSISTELVGRDQVGVNDYAGVIFDTYLDQINGVGFFVTPLGEQLDVKYALGREDVSWSTIFQSATQVTDSGWIFEMRIPYSALRFSKNKVQRWGMNFIRRRTKTGEQFSWNPIDPNKFGLMSQAGQLTNIENIKSPIRLSFSPYFSVYVNNNPSHKTKNQWEGAVNGGMDVKYGLSKGFTLDMTLIPDFGQVQSDDQILNLSPFEVRYSEKRSFFTEGTELFNKGNLFYSRRIGGTLVNYSLPFYGLSPGDSIIENPLETKLVNATKISGRTSKGLGIGLFNAITKPQHAIIRDVNGNFYNLETSPWTNYNLFVLDQTMKNNSSITLVNTNVLRSGKDYDANVTAFLWDLYDKKVNWNVWGKVANSRLTNIGADPNLSGYNYEINLGKFRGPLNFEIHQFAADPKYQQNDLGYFSNNNYYLNGINAWYKINKPKSFYNSFFFRISSSYSQLYKPRRYQYFTTDLHAETQFKSLWTLGLNTSYIPEQQDFYEPRVAGRMVKLPGSGKAGFYVASNTAKKYSFSVEVNKGRSSKYDNNAYDFYLQNGYRFNNKLSIGTESYASFEKNNLGFSFLSGDSILFGLRNRNTVINTLIFKYNFNIKMGLNLRVRHYWSRVDYTRFYHLKEDGYQEDAYPVITTDNNPDDNANFFNVDMIYVWEFAQGSFINIAWKDASQLVNFNVNDRYTKNFSNILRTPQQNNFSIKVIYYLDYLNLRKRKK